MERTLRSSTEDCTETDKVTSVQLHHRRVLHFSDGTMEESFESDVEPNRDEVDALIDESQLPLGPRLRFKAHKLGDNILGAIDYVGNGISAFLGITTPKYASEMEYYKQSVADGKDKSKDLLEQA